MFICQACGKRRQVLYFLRHNAENKPFLSADISRGQRLKDSKRTLTAWICRFAWEDTSKFKMSFTGFTCQIAKNEQWLWSLATSQYQLHPKNLSAMASPVRSLGSAKDAFDLLIGWWIKVLCWVLGGFGETVLIGILTLSLTKDLLFQKVRTMNTMSNLVGTCAPMRQAKAGKDGKVVSPKKKAFHFKLGTDPDEPWHWAAARISPCWKWLHTASTLPWACWACGETGKPRMRWVQSWCNFQQERFQVSSEVHSCPQTRKLQVRSCSACVEAIQH